MATKVEEIKGKIEILQSLIDKPTTPENDKKNFRDAIAKFKEKLKEEQEKEKTSVPKEKPKTTVSKPKTTVSKPKTTVSKVKPKTVAKTTPKTTKTPKGMQVLSKNKVVIDGKEVSTDSQEFCDYLTEQWNKRREAAKSKKGTKKKTQSVMAQVADKIEKGIEKAIKTGASNQKPSIQKNPKVFIGKVEKLETATKNFLQQLKEVLGSEYDAKEVTETTKAINKLIEDLKKKYAPKK